MSSEERVCFDKEGFVIFMDSLRDAFGSAGESMVFHMSKRYGRFIIQSAKNGYTGNPQDYQVTMDRHLDKVRTLGWGEMSFNEVDWERGEFKVSMNNNTFLDYCKSGQDSMCFFIKGVMTGTIEEITHQHFNIVENKCAKKGDKGCEFILKRME